MAHRSSGLVEAGFRHDRLHPENRRLQHSLARYEQIRLTLGNLQYSGMEYTTLILNCCFTAGSHSAFQSADRYVAP